MARKKSNHEEEHIDLSALSQLLEDDVANFDENVALDLANMCANSFSGKLNGAVELTKIILQHSDKSAHNEQAIYDLFEKSLTLISKHDPLQALLQQEMHEIN